MKIFGMVGMHTSGFERFVEALDNYALNNLDNNVLIQYGSTIYTLKQAKGFSYASNLDKPIAEADLIVGQASISILEALGQGKRIVIVPRFKQFGEVLDDHQIRFGEVIHARNGWPLVKDMKDLPMAIEQALTRAAPAPFSKKQTGLHLALKEYIEEVAKIFHSS